MLIKEYRIPLPLTVEEYRIAQLYMIAKKSREESSGAGSGVEIRINEPYRDGPGGNGQYTHKIYHVGSHLPGWLKAILPKTALMVEEEAWNAYPYTRTRYTCPFVEKFLLEIETYYYDRDRGGQDNVFQLSGGELRSRQVDVIDVVRDQLHGADYSSDEDPTLYTSKRTGRGPLPNNWLEVGEPPPLLDIMCAYKLCRVEFRYWGMQTKIERFIHDVALRKTMLRAHRQAWAWQDEWYGLTMADIREIERRTQMALQRKMGGAATSIDSADNRDSSNNVLLMRADKDGTDINIHDGDIDDWGITPPSNTAGGVSASSTNPVDLFEAGNWRIATLGRDSDTSEDLDDVDEGGEDEFYDCEDWVGVTTASLTKWTSLELLREEEDDDSTPDKSQDDSIFSSAFLQRVSSERCRGVQRSCSATGLRTNKTNSIDASILMEASSPASSSLPICSTQVLLLVLHSGSVLDATMDLAAKKSDLTTFCQCFDTVIRQHYPSMLGRVAVRLVACPAICTESLAVLSSLCPYSFDSLPTFVGANLDSTSPVPPLTTHDTIPIGAIPILASVNSDYADCVLRTLSNCNSVYQEFIKSSDGSGFTGQVSIVADSLGSILVYDALCKPHDADGATVKFDFDVCDVYMFGSPLALVLAFRRISSTGGIGGDIHRPCCQQVYNLFHPTDPVAARFEPLLSARFAFVSPVNVPRYAKYPLGTGQVYHLLDTIQSHSQLFIDSLPMRRVSDASIQSSVSGVVEHVSLQAITNLQQKWWGSKRIDYALYCPDGLANFPTNVLPHLLHASFWESDDALAFIIRQSGGLETLPTHPSSSLLDGTPTRSPLAALMGVSSAFGSREKWMRKRTSVKVKNTTANHRANDVVCREGAVQVISARFMYGPLDMVALTGERVDVYVMMSPPAGEWQLLLSEVTDKTGRVVTNIPEEKALTFGIHPIKMVVRGDHTSVDFYLAVVPPRTECVVFSIDGSFTASVSVSGRDPKVRAGAVDVVRHWQDLGYLILYITGRPDMQHRRVVSWLTQHNFPHGLVSFADGLSTDPLGHKAAYLSNLIQTHEVVISAAYGSSKDISVYQAIGLRQRQIYIVGRTSKKHQQVATALVDGYAAHLSALIVPGGSRPAQGNARMVIPRIGGGGTNCTTVTPTSITAHLPPSRRRSNDTTTPSSSCSSPVRASRFLKHKMSFVPK